MRAADDMRTSIATVKPSTPFIDGTRLLRPISAVCPFSIMKNTLRGLLRKEIFCIAMSLASVRPVTESKRFWASRRVDLFENGCVHFASPTS